MPKYEDLKGKTFGEWTAIEYVPDAPTHQTTWKCKCSCGSVGYVQAYSLKRGNSKRCRDCANKKLSLHMKRNSYEEEKKKVPAA